MERPFEKRLMGETAPSRELTDRANAAAHALLKLAPWDITGEELLIAVQPRDGSDVHYCSALGEMGVSLALQAFSGADGLRLLLSLAEERPDAPVGHLLQQMNAVAVDFAPARNLTKEDKAALSSWPPGRGKKAQYRSYRAGHFPWYPTETELSHLVDCMEAGNWFYSMLLKEGPELPWWTPDSRYLPLMSWDGEWRMEQMEATPAPPRVEPVPMPDPTTVRHLLRHPKKGKVQLAPLFPTNPIGEKNQRPSLMRVAMVVEADTALVAHTEIVGAGPTDGELVLSAAIKAIQARRAIPSEFQVMHSGYLQALAPLAKALGTRVKLVDSAPALEYAANALLAHLEA